MTLLDAGIVCAFLIYAIVAGFWSREAASRNLEEYFLAGRSLKGWQAGLSMAATQFSSDTPLLVTGLIATSGVFALWRLWIYAVAFLFMGFVLAASWRRAGILTDAEFTEIRYHSSGAAPLRLVKALYFSTVVNWTVLAMVLLAVTRVAEPFLLWHDWLPHDVFAALVRAVEWVGFHVNSPGPEAQTRWEQTTDNIISIGLIVLVTLLYSTTGGLRSVVATDIVQFVLALVGTGIFAWYVLDYTGGLAEVLHQIHVRFASAEGEAITADQLLAFTPSRAKDVSAAVLLMLSLQWLLQMNADGTGYLAQRTMACRSDRDATQAAVTFTIAQILVRSLLWLPLGLGLLVLFPADPLLTADALSADREFTFVRGIAETLPPGIKGLLLTGMLAAFASTVDTQLNWGASYWTNDLYNRFLNQGMLKRVPSGRELVWVARFSNIGTLAGAMAIVPLLSSLQTAWRISLLLGAGMGAVLVLRWLWWRLTAWGELASIVASAALAPVLLLLVSDEQDALRILAIAAVSTLAAVLVSWFTGPEPLPALGRFYLKVHPPGFWGPVAASVGEAEGACRARLVRGVTLTGVAALSVLSVLTGMGSWLIESPPPTWFPWRSLWIGLLLLLGLGVSPLWISALVKQAKHSSD
jgi:solute:Na+ symporter, SSS family